MKASSIQVLRLVTGIISVLLFANESSFWWIGVIPWAVLCIAGIFATIPLVLVIGIGVGAAQADWMSDEFIIGLMFVTPTALAVLISEVFRRRRSKVKGDATLQETDGSAA